MKAIIVLAILLGLLSLPAWGWWLVFNKPARLRLLRRRPFWKPLLPESEASEESRASIEAWVGVVIATLVSILGLYLVFSEWRG